MLITVYTSCGVKMVNTFKRSKLIANERGNELVTRPDNW